MSKLFKIVRVIDALARETVSCAKLAPWDALLFFVSPLALAAVDVFDGHAELAFPFAAIGAVGWMWLLDRPEVYFARTAAAALGDYEELVITRESCDGHFHYTMSARNPRS